MKEETPLCVIWTLILLRKGLIITSSVEDKEMVCVISHNDLRTAKTECIITVYYYSTGDAASSRFHPSSTTTSDISIAFDNITSTCTAFSQTNNKIARFRYQPATCISDRMTVTMTGKSLDCRRHFYITPLNAEESLKWQGKWDRCQLIWSLTEQDNDWCAFDCTCQGPGGCTEIEIQKRMMPGEAVTWELCNLLDHCEDRCPTTVCYNGGTCVSGTCVCTGQCRGSYCTDCFYGIVGEAAPVVTVIVGNDQFSAAIYDDWIFLLKRLDGSENFDRPWNDYKQGFGDFYKEHWIGNEQMYLLTNNGSTYKLRVDMVTATDTWVWAEYTNFRIDSEANNYAIHFGTYSGTAGDMMLNNANFNSKDNDNDLSVNNCAYAFNGPWWTLSCFNCKLTGIYGPNRGLDSILWTPHSNLKYADMKIRIM